MRKHTVILEEFEDNEYELDFEPTGEVLKARVGDKVVMSYLTYDEHAHEMGDCMGEMISFHRSNSQHHERGFRALKEDRDAVLLDCYSHSGERWSIHGGGMQCQWDTARGAGVWIPDEGLKQELDSTQAEAVYAIVERTSWVRSTGKMFQLMRVDWTDKTHCEKVHVRFSDDASALHKEAKELRKGKPKPTKKQLAWGREQMARIYCGQFLEEFNSILCGDVYGCITQVFHEDGGELDSDSCWGFVGSEYAEETLLHEFFEPECKRQQAKYDEECRTQNGRQLELEL